MLSAAAQMETQSDPFYRKKLVPMIQLQSVSDLVTNLGNIEVSSHSLLPIAHDTFSVAVSHSLLPIAYDTFPLYLVLYLWDVWN